MIDSDVPYRALPIPRSYKIDAKAVEQESLVVDGAALLPCLVLFSSSYLHSCPISNLVV